jgi:hypothetical protein
MLIFDIAMPLTLLLVTLASLALSKRVEGKLKATVEEREFRIRDIVLLVILITVAVSVVVFVPSMALTMFFLFSMASLLFIFSYLFSGGSKRRALSVISAFGLASLVAGIVALMGVFESDYMIYGGVAALSLTVFSCIAIGLELRNSKSGNRWYLAALPSALFIILFFTFNSTPVWFPILFDVFGIVFAILITLYLSSLFTWKTTFIFAALLTIMDFILVLIVPVMGPAASHIAELGLPVLIYMPVIPPIPNAEAIFGLQPIALGLGDFFFAGTLATQTYKKFGRKIAILSAIAMTITFGIFEILLLNADFNAFPGTLMIILGWLPIVAWKTYSERKKKNRITVKNKE